MRVRSVGAACLAATCALGGAAGCVDLDSLLVGTDAGGAETGVGGGADGGRFDGGDAASTALDAGTDATSGGKDASDGATASDSPTVVDAPVKDAPIDAPASDGPTVTGPPWWNSAYAHREQLTVTNGSGQTLPAGFQLGWAADVQSLATKSGSYDEVRLVWWDASAGSSKELTRVIDELGSNGEYIWARLAEPVTANTTDSSYYLYFGNASPPPAPNSPASVFDFYDSLSAATLSASWAAEGSYAMTGSEIELETNATIYTQATWGAGNAVDFVLRDPTYSGRYWGGLQLAASFADDSPWVVWIARNASSPATIWPEIEIGSDPISVGASVTVTTGAALYGVEWFGTRGVFRLADATQYDQPSSSTYTDSLAARFTNESADPIYVSDVRVRQAAYPEPSVATGPVQP
ncbi:MAG TPA: hypothetical protein VGG39_28245 [Polyangiaceae bacterium]|jgi:hypothetical protein